MAHVLGDGDAKLLMPSMKLSDEVILSTTCTIESVTADRMNTEFI